MSHFIILKDVSDHGDASPFSENIEKTLKSYGMSVSCYEQLNRTIVHADLKFELSKIIEILEKEMSLDVDDHWSSVGPSGHTLEVTLYYPDERQVVSATIDEGELVSALRSVPEGEERERRRLYAVTALAYDNDFPSGYSLFGDGLGIVLHDFIDEAGYWYEWQAFERYPSSDGSDLRAEFTFKPMAYLVTGELVEIFVESLTTMFTLPAAALLTGIDTTDKAAVASLLERGSVPGDIRAFVKNMPYELILDNPDVFLANTAETPAT